MPSVIYGGCMQALTFLWLLVLAEAATRTYYVGIVEENWDYAPTGKNLITGQSLTEDEHASEFVKRGANRIGRIYKKAVYKQFTDATYTQEVPKPSWLGFLGPVMKAQEEDIFLVHLKNFASRPYSLHPHGLFYDKDSEGALYPDGTSGKSKEDDFVVPNGNYTYTWPVKKEYAPTMADPTCLTWIYHSHIDTPRDISSGLIGPLLVCKKGSLDESLIQSTDAAKGFALMYSTVDENLSWYIDANIKAFCSDPATVDKEDEGFKNSNKMHAINGYIFGNLPTLEMCAGEFISWYLIGMGNEIDIHSAYFYGHTITNKGHRADTVNLFPATFITVEMIAGNIGKWLLTCQVSEHLQAGMKGLYHVQTCHKNVSQPLLAGQERRYFIAAEAVLWDYGPEGYDQFTGQALNTTGSESEPFFTRGIDRIGGRYWKVQYVEYTDEKFTRKKNQTESTMHLGILGPVIKAEVGDTLLVTFANKAEKNYSIMPHGVIYSKQSEGTPYLDGHWKLGAYVKPSETFTYKWRVPENVGPTASDPQCLTYLYYSAADPVMDTNSGLVGPLIICRKNTLNHDGTQKGIDKEFYLLFTVFDENLSWYLDKNIDVFIGDPSKVNKEDEDFQESNKMHAVNGYLFGNLPGLVMCKDDKVSWHMIGLGTFTDMHGVHFQGNTIHLSGMTRDTLALFPHSSGTALMQPDRVGVFQVVCRTFDHFVAGMKQLYEVNSCSSAARPGQPYGTMRTYYIAAEEVEWDYAPNKTWALSGKDASYGEIFVSSGEDRIGSKYEKVVYREYTSGEFTEHKVRSAQEEHLAILGPLIHAEVGDSILVIFKNKGIRPYSITAHGIEEVGSEERPGTLITMPGEINTYRWNVPERSGPGTSDPNCISWVYYSTVNFVKDTHSGLIGPLVVCRKGILNEKGLRKDIDSEFALLFLVFDENESWYLNENIEKYLHKFPNYFNYTADFLESNIMHAINGKVYDNLQGLTMKEGANTNWYLIGMGNEIDIHTVHFHGETFIFKTDKDHRADVYDLFPGTFQTIELRADNPGTWLLHCHVADHIHGGMETTFTISKSDNTVPLKGGVTATAYDTITVKHKAPVKDGDQKGINFLGKTLGAREANSVLIALFSIGLVLLITILIFIILITFQRKRVYYRTVQPKCALPTDSL
uniref:ferroxidase n=1 Tax=Pelodiscus sinensis TaxID=13735 RepID=K7FAZ4_PELSI|nr:hephaestin-like protein 1 isoform X1 [Pelodiscus sinensis]XP_006134466.1 hephaestin-like protein 1 isoform X2 [Pelodiscus sinensis]|eukprot:XP_006134465.1 hephaestin-like protein 1 isoform X1 [Pelodiscus sinensis]